MAAPTDSFYKRLALIRLVTFVIVFSLALALNGWRRSWTPMSLVLIEVFVFSAMVMILSLPLAWIRTKMVMERKEANREKENTETPKGA